MQENEKVQEIRKKKRELERHYRRFKELREAGDSVEALKQFNVTLEAAGKLMEVSTRVLKDLASGDISRMDSDLGGGKVFHFPKRHKTH
ncbi:MAG: hypothetical protein ACE5FN_05085 [Leptospirillia bacterium]